MRVDVSKVYGSYVGSNIIDKDDLTLVLARPSDDVWVRLDLGGNFDIASLQLTATNRAWTRLNGAVVELRDSFNNTVYTFDPISGVSYREMFTLVPDENVVANYIYINGVSNQYLSFAELDVFGTKSSIPSAVNLLDLTGAQPVVTMSSVYGAYVENNLIDNDPLTFSLAKPQSDVWMNVDLGGNYDVTVVEVTNRNLAGYRLNGAVVELRDELGNTVHSFDPISNPANGEVLIFNVGEAVRARSVHIQGVANEYLQVAEVDVFGFEPIADEVSVLSLNFGSNVDGGAINELAGVVQAGNWNNLVNSSAGTGGTSKDVATNLLLADGTVAEGVSVEWARNLSGSSSDTALVSNLQLPNPDTDNGRLFKGAVQTTISQTLGVDISGLILGLDETFDVYVYLDAGDINSDAGSSVRSISAGSKTALLDDPQGSTFAGEFDDATTDGVGNYVVLKNLSVSDLIAGILQIRIDDAGGSSANRPSISALQIVRGPGKDTLVDVASNAFGGDFDTDFVAGDNGIARLFNGELYELITTDVKYGGADTISSGEDGDVVLGGFDADDIAAGAGHDLVLGDNARIILFGEEVVGLAEYPLISPQFDPVQYPGH